MNPRVTAVILAYQREPWLERSVRAVLGSEGVDADVVLVDNGGTDGEVDRLRGLPGVTVVGTGTNLGFSGGCNLGAASATGDHLALVNGDLEVAPDALVRLVAVADEPDVGIASRRTRACSTPLATRSIFSASAGSVRSVSRRAPTPSTVTSPGPWGPWR